MVAPSTDPDLINWNSDLIWASKGQPTRGKSAGKASFGKSAASALKGISSGKCNPAHDVNYSEDFRAHLLLQVQKADAAYEAAVQKGAPDQELRQAEIEYLTTQTKLHYMDSFGIMVIDSDDRPGQWTNIVLMRPTQFHANCISRLNKVHSNGDPVNWRKRLKKK